MGREIKFRVWHKGMNEMLTVYAMNQQRHAGLEYCGACLGWFGDNHQVEFTYDQADWMQYTGLTDKNGKEIYEGDILSLWPGITTGMAKIVFTDGAWQYEYLTDPQAPDAYEFQYNKMDEHEIIGNIYQNPELTKS